MVATTAAKETIVTATAPVTSALLPGIDGVGIDGVGIDGVLPSTLLILS